MPYPENLDHHFVVDPTKFDFSSAKFSGGTADFSNTEILGTELDFTKVPGRSGETKVPGRSGEFSQSWAFSSSILPMCSRSWV
jgi:hypothetical protein